MCWKVNSLHFVAFGTVSTVPDALPPWQRVFGGSPQQLQNAPIGQPPSSVASSVVGDYQFVINAHLGRTELILSPGPQPGGPPTPIADWEAALEILLGYATLASASMSCNRVAIVANFSEEADSPAKAAELFRGHVKLNSIPTTAVDLNFGFNIPKALIGSNEQMNRLSRWGTGVQQYFGMQMNSMGAAPTISMQIHYVSTLTVDVNTTLLDLNDDSLRESITKQLVSEVTSIAKGGYEYLIS